MSAGVGKTFRMLQEAHALLRNGIDVKISLIETHNRKEKKQMPCWKAYQLFREEDYFIKAKN